MNPGGVYWQHEVPAAQHENDAPPVAVSLVQQLVPAGHTKLKVPDGVAQQVCPGVIHTDPDETSSQQPLQHWFVPPQLVHEVPGGQHSEAPPLQPLHVVPDWQQTPLPQDVVPAGHSQRQVLGLKVS